MAVSTLKKVQEAISNLDEEQLDKVLHYTEELRENDLLNQRAKVSEDDVKYGRVISIDQFNKSFQEWREKKRTIK